MHFPLESNLVILYVTYASGVHSAAIYVRGRDMAMHQSEGNIIDDAANDGVNPHFSCVPPLDRWDSLFICEKLIFEKKLESPLFFFFLKGK